MPPFPSKGASREAGGVVEVESRMIGDAIASYTKLPKNTKYIQKTMHTVPMYSEER